MHKEIEKQIEDWKFIEGMAFDVLRILSDEQLDLTVGKNMGTLGEQFRHIARVRFQYAEAIENKKLGKTIEKIDPTTAQSKMKLIELRERANQRLINVIEKLDGDEPEKVMIDWKLWGIDAMNVVDHLNALMDHETLHNGELIVYLRTWDIKFPESWAAWGL